MDYIMRDINRNIKRRKQVRIQRFLLCLIVVITIVFLSIIFGSRFTYAENNDTGMSSQKFFKSITIESGDTLESIASEYISSEYKSSAQYINEVKQMNYMLDDDIRTGDSLIIPYYGYAITVAVQ